MPSTKAKLAFTLAEVLITLGIIGIVAAMTIPTLIANTNGQKYRSQFKKTVSILSQPVRIHDGIVQPATAAARYVLNTAK